MDIEIRWKRPVLLARHKKLRVDEKILPRSIENKGGVYFFSRKFGKTYKPFYVGESQGIRGRLKKHLQTVRIVDVLRGMPVRGFQNIRQGARYFHFGYFIAKPGQNEKKCIRIVQQHLIDEAVSKGLPLLNTQLTRIKTHTLKYGGNKVGRAIYPRMTEVPR